MYCHKPLTAITDHPTASETVKAIHVGLSVFEARVVLDNN